MAIAAVALPFINVAPNRLVSGEARALWQVWPSAPALLGLTLAAVVALSFWEKRTSHWLTLILCESLFIVLFWSAGLAAAQMVSVESPLARTSIGSGLWLWLALCLLACSDVIRRLTARPVWRWLLNAQIWSIPLWLLFSGELNNLSLLKEYANRQEVFDGALVQHLTILLGTLVPALLLGVPLGIWCYRHPARQGSVFAVLNVIQTIPSVALFGLLIAPLAGLVKSFPTLSSFGIAGTGLTPALIALVLYALLPLVRGVVAGLSQVPPDVLESAHAMGMRAAVFLENPAAAGAAAAGPQPAGGDGTNGGDGGDSRADWRGRLRRAGVPGAAQQRAGFGAFRCRSYHCAGGGAGRVVCPVARAAREKSQ